MVEQRIEELERAITVLREELIHRPTVSQVKEAVKVQADVLQTLIGQIRGHGQSPEDKSCLKYQRADKFMPTGFNGNTPFKEFQLDVENYVSALDPTVNGKALLRDVTTKEKPIDELDIADI